MIRSSGRAPVPRGVTLKVNASMLTHGIVNANISHQGPEAGWSGLKWERE